MVLLNVSKLDLAATTKDHQLTMSSHGNEVQQEQQHHGRSAMMIVVMIMVLHVDRVVAMQLHGLARTTIVAAMTTMVVKAAIMHLKDMQHHHHGHNSRTSNKPMEVMLRLGTEMVMVRRNNKWVLHLDWVPT